MKKILLALTLLSLASFANPSKPPKACGTTESLSVTDRIAECRETRLLSNSRPAQVAMRLLKEGSPQEYLFDPSAHLLWGPHEADKKNWTEAKQFCMAKKDLSLPWYLPTKEEYLKAFHTDNKDSLFNVVALEALGKASNRFWTSSSDSGAFTNANVFATVFNQETGELSYDVKAGKNHSVRCVADVAARLQ